MERPRSSPHRQQRTRQQKVCDAIKIMPCGGMIGTAILFPLANVEGRGFRAVTLSIFILSALGFHALHRQPFIRFGPFIFSAASVFLLVAVLAAGPSRKDFIPWLPLFIASVSLLTVAIYEFSQHVGPRPMSFSAEDNFTGVSIDNSAGYSVRTMSTQQPRRPVPESSRFDPLYFARHGPSSRSSHQTGTGTDISLSSIVGQCRPQWDGQTRSHFPDGVLPEQDATGEPQTRSTSPGCMSHADPCSDLDSARGSVESTHPLLAPQGGPIAGALP